MITAKPAPIHASPVLRNCDLLPGKLYEITGPSIHEGGIAMGVGGGKPLYLVPSPDALRLYPYIVNPSPIVNEIFEYRPYSGSVTITSE